MRNRLKKYLSLTRAGILEALQFRLALFVMVLGNLLYLTLTYFLWKAIFASSGSSEVNGMTFEMTMVYLVLASSLCGVVELFLVWEIGRSVQKGKIVLDLLRPMNYKRWLFFASSGTLVVNFFLTFVPTFIVVAVIARGTIVPGLNMLYFFVAAVLAVIINYNIDFIVGTICLYTESIWGVNIMRQVIVSLLSGATIPLAFFPEKLARIVNLLPFRAIYDTPLTLLLCRNPDFYTVAGKLGISAFWVVAISILSSLFWKVSIRQVTVNGG